VPYMIVFGEPVFIHRALDRRIREETLSEKDALFRVSSRIRGTAESLEAEELCFAYLEKVSRADPYRFREEWVCFDLQGEDAQKDVWDLLYDYSALTRNSRIKDIRDFASQIVASYSGDSYLYPMGRVFVMEFPINLPVPWWKKFWKRPAHNVSIMIDINRVQKLVGNLSEFTMVCMGFIARFSQSGVVVFQAQELNMSTTATPPTESDAFPVSR
jgi:hypothetical protein